jgi:L-amino acid N-acyltransferase YncA
MVANLKRKLHTAGEVFRKEGLSPFLREAIRKVGVVETYLAYGIDLSLPLPLPPQQVPLTVRRATVEDFVRFRAMPPPFRRHAEVYEKFGLNQCYLGLVDGEIAHIAWLYYPHERKRHPTRFCRLKSDEVAIANVVTVSPYRGKGVYPYVVHTLLSKLQNEGYRCCYIYIDGENVPSQRGIIKAGFKQVGRSWRIRLFHHYRKDPGAGIYIQGPRSCP